MGFNVGDVVYLNSNPEIMMTVSLVFKTEDVYRCGDKFFKEIIKSLGFSVGDDIIQCSWFNIYENIIEYSVHHFKPKMLKIKSVCTKRPSFKAGDRVCLKSNPEFPINVSMVLKTEDLYRLDRKIIKKVVQELGSFDDGDIQCTWFDKLDNEYVERFFKAEMLVKIA